MADEELPILNGGEVDGSALEAEAQTASEAEGELVLTWEAEKDGQRDLIEARYQIEFWQKREKEVAAALEKQFPAPAPMTSGEKFAQDQAGYYEMLRKRDVERAKIAKAAQSVAMDARKLRTAALKQANTRSPIDAAMAQRKPLRGSTRPMRAVPQE